MIAIGKAALALCSSIAMLAACSKEQPDAYGNFEATEVRVSAEIGGRLLRLGVNEGDRLAAGAEVGQIEIVTLALQREELVAQRRAATTRLSEADAQIRVLRAQLLTAQREYERTLRLSRVEAATAQQLNQTEGEVSALRERIRAANAQAAGAREETRGVESRVKQLEDQIGKGRIVNPTTGTVLATYAEAGEFVQPGQPLYTVADLDTLTLRAYVSGSQLAMLRIGQRVRVQVDAAGGGLVALPGQVIWIASEAEFTPTPIQTREERTDQVYAVKISVPNRNGVLKIGMPGEVVFTDAEEGGRTAAALLASKPPAIVSR